MPTPIKLQNPTIVGSGDPDSTQLSHPSRFCHWRPSFGDNGYPPCKSTTQNQNLFPRKDFNFLPTQAQKKHLLQLGIHGDPAKRDLRKIIYMVFPFLLWTWTFFRQITDFDLLDKLKIEQYGVFCPLL